MKITIHSTRETRQFTFGRDATIGTVTAEAARVFDFRPDDEYGLLLSCNASTPLQIDRTLESYSILDGATLFLTVTGCRRNYLG